jgi:hypothetical protein
MLKLNNSLAKELISTQDANKCTTQTLDAKYKKTDLQQSIKREEEDCKHQSANHQKKLLQFLIKYESLFDGTLGDWKTKPVSFQLKEENNCTMACPRPMTPLYASRVSHA